jgi:hypothetical protein
MDEFIIVVWHFKTCLFVLRRNFNYSPQGLDLYPRNGQSNLIKKEETM